MASIPSGQAAAAAAAANQPSFGYYGAATKPFRNQPYVTRGTTYNPDYYVSGKGAGLIDEVTGLPTPHNTQLVDEADLRSSDAIPQTVTNPFVPQYQTYSPAISGGSVDTPRKQHDPMGFIQALMANIFAPKR